MSRVLIEGSFELAIYTNPKVSFMIIKRSVSFWCNCMKIIIMADTQESKQIWIRIVLCVDSHGYKLYVASLS